MGYRGLLSISSEEGMRCIPDQWVPSANWLKVLNSFLIKLETRKWKELDQVLEQLEVYGFNSLVWRPFVTGIIIDTCIILTLWSEEAPIGLMLCKTYMCSV